MFQAKVVEEIVYSITVFFFRIWCCLFDMEKYYRPQITIWRMRVAWWIPKAKKYKLKNVIVFYVQMQRLRKKKRTSVLRLTYRGTDNSLARPGKKQANICVRMAWISFRRLALQEKQLDDSTLLDVVEIARIPYLLPSLFPSWSD